MSKSSVWTYRKIRKNLAEFIGEKYANAMTHEDKSVDADAEEKQ